MTGLIGWLGAAYPWVKAAHIIFVIFWMAGLFMLPRFFIYHQDEPVGSDQDRKWIERERRLLQIILRPAFAITWVLGLALAFDTGAFAQQWFWLKLLAVIGLSGYHGWMTSYARELANGTRTIEGRTLRLLNEIPGVAAAVIVVLVIVRPF